MQSLHADPSPRNEADIRRAAHAALDAFLDALPKTAPEPMPTAPVAPQLFDKRELARSLDVSVATIDRLDRDGQPFIRVGDSKRYDLSAVLEWHRARTVAAPTDVPSDTVEAPAEPTGVQRRKRTS